MAVNFDKDIQYYKFCLYGFFKNMRFFEPFFILFFLENGISYFQIGILYGIREVLINLFEIPSGIISDVIGRRRTMIASFIGYILSFLVFYFFAEFWLFVVAMVFYSLGDAFRSGTHKAIIFDYLKLKGWNNQKVSYYGHTRSWSQMGSAFSALIAVVIVIISGNLQLVFLFATIPYIFDLLLLISYPKEIDGFQSGHDKSQILSHAKDIIKEFYTSFKSIELIRIVSNISLYSGFYKASKDFLQVIIQSVAVLFPIFLKFEGHDKTAVFVGVAYFIIFIVTSFLSKNSGTISSWFKHLSLPLNISLLIGFSFGVVAGILYYLGYAIPAAIIYTGIYFIENIRQPIGTAYITTFVSHDILATALSAKSQAKSLFAFIIAPLIGFTADEWGIGISLAVVSFVLIVLSPIVFAKRN